MLSVIASKGPAEMSPEEKLVLFTVLQDIADELRRIDRESKKERQQENQKHSEERSFQASVQYGISQRRKRRNLREAV